jgi:hypothetical protein
LAGESKDVYFFTEGFLAYLTGIADPTDSGFLLEPRYATQTAPIPAAEANMLNTQPTYGTVRYNEKSTVQGDDIVITADPTN